jgi:hypothetical protein
VQAVVAGYLPAGEKAAAEWPHFKAGMARYRNRYYSINLSARLRQTFPEASRAVAVLWNPAYAGMRARFAENRFEGS